MNTYIRAEVARLPDYQPIPDPAAAARELGLSAMAKLDTNETPYGPLPGVQEAVASAARTMHHYPDLSATRLITALAEHYSLDPDGIAVGNGSAGLIEALIKGITRPGDEVIYSWRSFEAYPLIATLAGATAVPVPRAADHSHDLPALLNAVTSRTRLIILCNPSNPTGTYLAPEHVEDFLARVPPHVLVALDEAYHEFVTPRPAPDSLQTVVRQPNALVLRSFSKAWGMAGLRTGWLYAAPPLAQAIRKCVMPFSVNSLAQAGATAALGQTQEMTRRSAQTAAERDSLAATLRLHTPGIPASQGNFLWIPLGSMATPFAYAAKRHGIIVRAFANEGVRITIGTAAENAHLATVYPQILRQAQTAAVND